MKTTRKKALDLATLLRLSRARQEQHLKWLVRLQDDLKQTLSKTN